MKKQKNNIPCAEVKLIKSEQYSVFKLMGCRNLKSSINIWTIISTLAEKINGNLLIEDNMSGSLSTFEISELLDKMSNFKIYRHNRIAIILKESSSYIIRFYELAAARCGLLIKHFIEEREAIKWLLDS